MAVTDKYSHHNSPPPSYEEVQLKGVAKKENDPAHQDDKTEEKKDGEGKTEEEIPPVGMFELV